MEVRDIGNWNLDSKTEVYYDKIFRHYIVKNKSNIEVRPLGITASFTVTTDKDSQKILNNQFTHLQINVPRGLIACLSIENEIHLFKYQSYKQFKVLIEKSKILGFHFISNPESECFFFIVQSAGLYLFKTNNTTTSISLIKYFQVPVNEYCFEPTEGILLLITPTGTIVQFLIYQKNGPKHYQSSSFDLHFDSTSNKSVTSGPKSSNLLTYSTRLEYNQVKLVKVYSELYFVHLDNLRGRLYLYSISQTNLPVIYAAFSIPQGLHSVGVTENLLAVLNYNSQETLIYDIQRQLHGYVAKIHHCSETIPEFNRTYAESYCIFELNPKFFFVDDEVIADLNNLALKTFKFNPSVLIGNHPDEVKVVFFLLKRENCKIKLLERIKAMLIHKISIKKLEAIFSTMALNYKLALEDSEYEMNATKLSENSKHYESSSSEVNPNIEVKSGAGVTIILQSDLYFCVFAPVYKEISDLKYFSEVLYTFIHYLIQNNIDVQLSIQYLLFKVMIKNGEYLRVQKLVEIKFFTDSQDIALFLTSLGKSNRNTSFPNCFNLGIDMLFRLKLAEMVAQELADQEFYLESLEICKTLSDSSELTETLVKNCGFSLEWPINYNN